MLRIEKTCSFVRSLDRSAYASDGEHVHCGCRVPPHTQSHAEWNYQYGCRQARYGRLRGRRRAGDIGSPEHTPGRRYRWGWKSLYRGYRQSSCTPRKHRRHHRNVGGKRRPGRRLSLETEAAPFLRASGRLLAWRSTQRETSISATLAIAECGEFPLTGSYGRWRVPGIHATAAILSVTTATGGLQPTRSLVYLVVSRWIRQAVCILPIQATTASAK
jgi:hypothetical protein